jgi:hypothetical protein
MGPHGLEMRWLKENDRSRQEGLIEKIIWNPHIDLEVIGNIYESPEMLVETER